MNTLLTPADQSKMPILKALPAMMSDLQEEMMILFIHMRNDTEKCLHGHSLNVLEAVPSVIDTLRLTTSAAACIVMSGDYTNCSLFWEAPPDQHLERHEFMKHILKLVEQINYKRQDLIKHGTHLCYAIATGTIPAPLQSLRAFKESDDLGVGDIQVEIRTLLAVLVPQSSNTLNCTSKQSLMAF